MKTSNLSIRQLTGKFSVLLFIAAAFFTSCQKDQLAPPNGLESQTQNVIAKNSAPYGLEPQTHNEVGRMAAAAFSVAVIDHSDPQRILPSYKVELFSDGLIQFEGRENTAFVGRIQAIASQNQIDKINALFKLSNFKSMIDATIIDGDAKVETSFASSSTAKVVTHVDNTKKLQALVTLRQQVEDILQIGKWVK